MFARIMGLTPIAPEALHQMMQAGSVTVVDVNARESWMAHRIPGALHLPPLDYEAHALPDDKDTPLVFYCSNRFCRKAPKAARRAIQMGYTNVQVMSAGINGWRNADLPTESGAPSTDT